MFNNTITERMYHSSDVIGVEQTEYSDFIRFVSKVFHRNFKTLIPKLYTDNPSVMRYHHAIKKGSKYVGGIANVPYDIKLGSEVVKAYEIGMVSCDKSERGHGVMSALLGYCIDEATRNGGDIMLLDGLRQRYESVGFEPIGTQYHFKVNRINMKKRLPNPKPYTLEKVTDNRYSEFFYEMYCKKAVYAVREKERFFEYMNTWRNKVYAIVENNKPIGYMIAKHNKIYEISLLDGADILSAINAYFSKKLWEIDVVMCPYDDIKILADIAEHSEVHSFAQGKILDYRSFVGKTLRFCHSKFPLPAQTISLCIEGVDSFSIIIDDDIKIVDLVSEPTVNFTEKEFTLSVFGNTSYMGLFKIPFAIPHIDMI